MFSKRTARRSIRGAVKKTRKTLNRALDAAEPRLEKAALELRDLGSDAAKTVRARSLDGLSELKSGYGKLERKVRNRISPPKRHGAKAALLAAGVAAIAVALLK